VRSLRTPETQCCARLWLRHTAGVTPYTFLNWRMKCVLSCQPFPQLDRKTAHRTADLTQQQKQQRAAELWRLGCEVLALVRELSESLHQERAPRLRDHDDWQRSAARGPEGAHEQLALDQLEAARTEADLPEIDVATAESRVRHSGGNDGDRARLNLDVRAVAHAQPTIDDVRQHVLDAGDVTVRSQRGSSFVHHGDGPLRG
jgi:hypothetical protein